MSQSPLSGVVEELDTILLLHDAETGEVVDANPAATDLYGYSVEELTDMSVGEFSSESERYTQARAERVIEAAAGGEPQEFDWQIKRKDGTLLWVTVRLKPVTIDGTEYVLAEQEDVTEYKTRTRRLSLLYRIIRHNLRNDMTVVMGHAESLERDLTAERHREQAAQIVRTAKQVGEMTDAVSEIERITQAGAAERTPTDVTALLSDIVEEIRRRYPDATVRFDPDTEVYVSADEGLRRALEHAVENAVEHSDQQHPVAEVSVDSVPEERSVSIEIADDGPAIPGMELEALRLDGETNDTNHGTGVGLFVMKWCTESLGGDLHVRERESRGNLVRFTFPTCEDRPDSAGRVAV